MLRSIFLTFLGLCLVLASCASSPPSVKSHLEGAARIANVDDQGLAIDGYDPVAYFPQGGAKPRKGDPALTAQYEGVTYAFANGINRMAFLDDPEHFIPAYGGWCAWAMADKEPTKVEIDPESFTLEQQRLFLFYDSWSADTRKSWLKHGGAPGLAFKADRNWRKFQRDGAKVSK